MVFTLPAYWVGTNDAAVGGWLFSLGTSNSVNVSFGWDNVSHAGDPAGYSYWTAPQVKTRPGYFTAFIHDLKPNTFYYFRAREVGNVTNYGIELRFKTFRKHPWWPWDWWP